MLSYRPSLRRLADDQKASTIPFARRGPLELHSKGARFAKNPSTSVHPSFMPDRLPGGAVHCSDEAVTAFPHPGAAKKPRDARSDHSEGTEEGEVRGLALSGLGRKFHNTHGRNLFGLHSSF